MGHLAAVQKKWKLQMWIDEPMESFFQWTLMGRSLGFSWERWNWGIYNEWLDTLSAGKNSWNKDVCGVLWAFTLNRLSLDVKLILKRGWTQVRSITNLFFSRTPTEKASFSRVESGSCDVCVTIQICLRIQNCICLLCLNTCLNSNNRIGSVDCSHQPNNWCVKMLQVW